MSVQVPLSKSQQHRLEKQKEKLSLEKKAQSSREFNLVAPGGIGDNIIALPIIREIYNRCHKWHDFTLYTKFPDIMEHFLPEFKGKCFGDKQAESLNDKFLVLLDVPNFRFADVETIELCEPLAKMFDAWRNAYPEWGILIRNFPRSVNQIAQRCLSVGLHRNHLPRYLLGLECEEYSYPFVTWKEEGSQPYITIHDGYDTSMQLSNGFSTKNWPIANWKKFVEMFKSEYPTYAVVQLGTAKSRPIPGAFTKLLGKLTFPETLQELAHSAVHVDGESGLVHARHMLKKPSVVMYGPTPMEFYAYPTNENIASGTCFPCFWIQPNWQHACSLEGGEPVCMKDIAPETVMARVRKLLIRTNRGEETR